MQPQTKSSSLYWAKELLTHQLFHKLLQCPNQLQLFSFYNQPTLFIFKSGNHFSPIPVTMPRVLFFSYIKLENLKTGGTPYTVK